MKLYNKYHDQGFQPVFATYMGSTGFRENPTVDEELEFDRHHWVDENDIHFPIAIVDPPKTANGKGREEAYFMRDFCVNAFPTYVFIDAQGVVQYVQVGHSDDLEQKFSKVIERLLRAAKATELKSR